MCKIKNDVHLNNNKKCFEKVLYNIFIAHFSYTHIYVKGGFNVTFLNVQQRVYALFQ